MSAPRKPAAFRVEPSPQVEERGASAPATRKPRALKTEIAIVTPAEVDAFDLENLDSGLPAQIADPSRRPGWKSLFFGALGILMSLAIGLWTDKLIRDLFARADWLGWLATAMAALAALSATVIVVRELWGLARLASVEKLRRKAEDALARDDSKIALQVVEQLSSILASQPRVAAGRKLLAEQRGEVIDGRDLIRLAETEMLAPLDELARTLTLDAAKRVSIVTAVSPRALVDVAYVVFEAARLVKGISALYGGRPGTLGFLRLFRSVLAHLAVTGSIAVGDSFVQQIVGHGLAARLSAKLGEGVVNGMMTARIGLAAMDVVRPLPFSALKRPGMADFVSALTRFAAASSPAKK
jgi:putative membrane protein